MDSTIKEVKDQYNRFPYPRFSWLAQVDPADSCHASFEAGASIIHKTFINHDGKRIALLGCGTFEPYVMGKLHQRAQVTAVDISPKSLRWARLRCKLRKVKNVEFKEDDVVAFCKSHEDQFDFIHCYGVLHHLPNPVEGFKALALSLKPQGFARIMVYSKGQRRNATWIRKGARALGISSRDFLGPFSVKALLRCLPLPHPLKLSQLSNPELASRSGTIDSLLHSCENPFSIRDLQDVLRESSLFVHSWDFSKNLRALLDNAPGKTVEDKIDFLESFDQWPGPFTFWVSNMPPAPIKEIVYRTNPYLKMKSQIPSAVLKTTLRLSDGQRDILERGLQENVSFSDPSAIAELIQARFIMEVEN